LLILVPFFAARGTAQAILLVSNRRRAITRMHDQRKRQSTNVTDDSVLARKQKRLGGVDRFDDSPTALGLFERKLFK